MLPVAEHCSSSLDVMWGSWKDTSARKGMSASRTQSPPLWLNLDHICSLQLPDLDLEGLFSNTDDILHVSKRFLKRLEATATQEREQLLCISKWGSAWSSPVQAARHLRCRCPALCRRDCCCAPTQPQPPYPDVSCPSPSSVLQGPLLCPHTATAHLPQRLLPLAQFCTAGTTAACALPSLGSHPRSPVACRA